MPKTATAPRTRKPAAEAAPATPPDETNDQTPPDESETGTDVATTGAAGASRALSIAGIRAEFLPRALVLPDKLTIQAWTKVVEAIDGVREGARWWFGDALNGGEARFGEKYGQALDAGKYDYVSLRNMASVAKKFPADTRIYDVSWSHYHAVASLPPDVAGELLAEAAQNDWSVVQIRESVREIKKAGKDATDTPPSRNGAGAAPNAVVSPNVENQPGIKPLTDEEVAAADANHVQTFECEGCPRIFGSAVWHCMGCGSHWSLEADECQNPHCGEDVPATTAPTPTPTAARTGTILTAAEADTTGQSDALTVLVTYPFADLDPSDIGALLAASESAGDHRAALVALHGWIGQVIEAMRTDDEGDDTDALQQSEAEDDEADDGIGDLDLGDDETDSETDDPSDGPEDAPEAAPEAPVTRGKRPVGAWSTKGANVVPDETPEDKPFASEPARPAPRPTPSKPVRRRGQAAATAAE